jgi:hypothetical protein
VATGGLDAAGLDAAANEIFGRSLDLAPDVLADALDLSAAIATRTVPGGAAREPMDAMLAGCRESVAGARAWIDRERTAIDRAEGDLVALSASSAG